MGKCLKGKSEVDEAGAKFVCKKCGAKTDVKGHVCASEKEKSLKGAKDREKPDGPKAKKKVKAAEKLLKAEKELAKVLKSAEKAVAKARRKVEKAKEKLAPR